MTSNLIWAEPLLATGQWDVVLKRWGQAFPPDVLGIRLAGFMHEVMPSPFHSLLELIVDGYQLKDDAVRWQVFEEAKKVGLNTPVGALALSLFWSYGSMAPLGQEPIYPDPMLSPQLLNCALTMLVSYLAEAPAKGVEILLSRLSVWEGN